METEFAAMEKPFEVNRVLIALSIFNHTYRERNLSTTGLIGSEPSFWFAEC
jgi:hypothetical protein